MIRGRGYIARVQRSRELRAVTGADGRIGYTQAGQGGLVVELVLLDYDTDGITGGMFDVEIAQTGGNRAAQPPAAAAAPAQPPPSSPTAPAPSSPAPPASTAPSS